MEASPAAAQGDTEPRVSAAALPPTPAPLDITYTPIQLRNQTDPAAPLPNATQFLVRIRNPDNATSLYLSSLSLQYWFKGPLESSTLYPTVDAALDASPWDFLQARCDWASSGCEGVLLGIIRGYPELPGARFGVNVTFNSSAGTLLPTGEAAAPPLFLEKGIEVLDILLTITTSGLGGATQLNSRQDYSYLDTPVLEQQQQPQSGNVASNAPIVTRQAQPNPQITSYVDGQLTWGIPPLESLFASPSPEAPGIGGGSAATGTGVDDFSNGNVPLPPGVTCEAIRGGSQQSCNLQALYCCRPADTSTRNTVTADIPAVWPPRPLTPIADFPPSLESDNTFTGGQGESPQRGEERISKKSNTTALVAGLAVGLGILAAAALYAGVFVLRLRRQRRERAAAASKGLPSVDDDVVEPHAGSATASPSTRHLPPWNTRSTSVSFRLHHQTSDALSQQHSNDALLASHATAHPGGSAHPPPWKSSSGFSGRSDPTNVLDTFGGSSNGDTFSKTLQALPAASLAAAAALRQQQAGEEPHSLPSGPGPLPSQLAAMLENKAKTSPAKVRISRSRRSLRGASLSHSTSLAASDLGGEIARGAVSDNDSAEEESGELTMAPWQQMRRSVSWDGVLHGDHSAMDSWTHMQRMKRRHTVPQLLQGGLPPLSPRPAPLLPNAGPAENVDLNVDPAELNLGQCLGTGGFGAVYEATWRGKKVAVKMLPPLSSTCAPESQQTAYDALLREIELSSKFACDRLVKVLGACTRDQEHCALIMELADGGSLYSRIYDRRKRRLGYLEILQLCHDIAEGLSYLHPSVVHRDLKPQNILLFEDGRVKIADFGISRVKDPAKSHFSQITAENGTPMYMAPEMMNATRIDEKVDVYALGVILNEAWARRQPWRGANHFFQIILKVAVHGERPWLDPDCPENLKRLIQRCWQPDPRQRPSCAEIVRLTELMIAEELQRWERLSGELPALPQR